MEISEDFVLAAFGVAAVAVLTRDWLDRRKRAANPDPQAHASAASHGASEGERPGGGDAAGGDGCGPGGDAC
jgi:hypothetical protein